MLPGATRDQIVATGNSDPLFEIPTPEQEQELARLTKVVADAEAAVHQLAGRPSIGSWVSYGLGSDNADLPA